MSKEKDNSRHIAVLLEDMNSKFDFLVELIVPLTVLPAQVAQLTADMNELKADLVITKRVLGDHSTTLKDHEYRLTHLESK